MSREWSAEAGAPGRRGSVMFITLAPWRIISLTSLPGPSCSPGKT